MSRDRQSAAPHGWSGPVAAAPADQVDHVVAARESVIPVVAERAACGDHSTQPNVAVVEPREERTARVTVVETGLRLDNLPVVVLIVVFHALIDLHRRARPTAHVVGVADIVPDLHATPVVTEGRGTHAESTRRLVQSTQHEIMTNHVFVVVFGVMSQIADITDPNGDVGLLPLSKTAQRHPPATSAMLWLDAVMSGEYGAVADERPSRCVRRR
jgi:hypothetical protein